MKYENTESGVEFYQFQFKVRSWCSEHGLVMQIRKAVLWRDGDLFSAVELKLSTQCNMINVVQQLSISKAQMEPNHVKCQRTAEFNTKGLDNLMKVLNPKVHYSIKKIRNLNDTKYNASNIHFVGQIRRVTSN